MGEGGSSLIERIRCDIPTRMLRVLSKMGLFLLVYLWLVDGTKQCSSVIPVKKDRLVSSIGV
jgi:hypothetical protein